MTFSDIWNLLIGIQVWTVAKAIVCFTLLLYTVFAVVVVRQVDLMTDAINFSLEWILKIVAMVHLLGAIFVFILAIIIL